MSETEEGAVLNEGVVDKYFNMNKGHIHIGWLLDSYWEQIVDFFILPQCLAIHKALVSRKITEKNKRSFYEDNNKMFYLPTKNRKHKVFLFEGWSDSFLFVMNQVEILNKDTFEPKKVWDLHVRSLHKTTQEDERQSLEYYKKAGYQIPNKISYIYGDIRDKGCVLSYKDESIDGAKYDIASKEMLLTLYLPVIIEDLKLKNLPCYS